MKVTATASTRIDFAGGTLDLYPLCLLLEDSLTVNASINLRSQAVVTPLPGTKVRIVSEDLGQVVEADSPDQLELETELGLLKRAVRFYAPGGGLELRVHSAVPKGSGLGASSSLLMSASRALSTFVGRNDNVESIIQWGSALETQNLRTIAGMQDYYGACLGGINGLRFGVTGTHISSLHPSEAFYAQLQESIVVSFTGISHFSGANNWVMLKRFIERDGDSVESLEAINATAHSMWDALLQEDLEALAAALHQEWGNRCALAQGVTTPQVDMFIETARQAGAMASKLCGAGGGGCLLTLAAPGKRQAVIEALQRAGAEILAAELDPTGISVSQTAE